MLDFKVTNITEMFNVVIDVDNSIMLVTLYLLKFQHSDVGDAIMVTERMTLISKSRGCW